MINLIVIRDTSFEVEVLDHTHIKFRITGTERWATALHFAQLDDAWVSALKEINLVSSSGRHFVFNEGVR